MDRVSIAANLLIEFGDSVGFTYYGGQHSWDFLAVRSLNYNELITISDITLSFTHGILNINPPWTPRSN